MSSRFDSVGVTVEVLSRDNEISLRFDSVEMVVEVASIRNVEMTMVEDGKIILSVMKIASHRTDNRNKKLYSVLPSFTNAKMQLCVGGKSVCTH